MWLRRILPILLGVVAALFDLAVAAWFPGPWTAVRAALPLTLLLALFSSPKRALPAALTSGIVLDAFLPTASMMTFRLLAAAGIVVLTSRVYLTNRTLLGSLILGAIGLAGDRLMRWVSVAIRGLSGEWVIADIPPPLPATAVWLAVCITITFFVFAAFTRRFLPLVSTRR